MCLFIAFTELGTCCFLGRRRLEGGRCPRVNSAARLPHRPIRATQTGHGCRAHLPGGIGGSEPTMCFLPCPDVPHRIPGQECHRLAVGEQECTMAARRQPEGSVLHRERDDTGQDTRKVYRRSRAQFARARLMQVRARVKV